ncbi:hypothetical protein GCM10023187_13910 [Nibrella viscosa]|uniref:Endonuclease/exonuclease/phosphatase domain-containing protein n=1 Tax=Nibrella viscosa TaxID=1084524 RepID=A0ABP8K5P3_9BACT
MNMFRRLLLYLVIIMGFLLTTLSVLSLFYDISRWYFELVDFPRLQYLLGAVVCLITQQQINYLEDDSVPSFRANVTLPAGQQFWFHGVHLVAPFPSDRYPDGIGEKEVTLLQVGSIVQQEALPTVVAGDFNDVSWSHTSQLFRARGKLHNVRIGRGLFNSYNAQSFIKRWSLDHFFVTREFAVQDFRRLPDIQSDHFPIYARLVLQRDGSTPQP